MGSTAGDAIDEAEIRDTGNGSAQTDDAASINRSGAMTDDKLKTVLKNPRANITMVGRGGAGGNTVDWMHEEGIRGAKLVVTDTNVQHLVEIGASTKILMGE